MNNLSTILPAGSPPSWPPAAMGAAVVVVVGVVVVVVAGVVVVVVVGGTVVVAVGFVIVIATSMEPPNSLKLKYFLGIKHPRRFQN